MLKNYVSVYVPGTYGTGGNLDDKLRALIVQDCGKRLSAAFGGATASNAQGYYIANNGELIVENVTIVKSYHDQEPTQALEIARGIAQWLKNTLLQEAVTVETESGIEFI